MLDSEPAELARYVESADFRLACYELEQRMAAGRDFSLEEMAEALGLPMAYWLEVVRRYTEMRIQAPVVVPLAALVERPERPN